MNLNMNLVASLIALSFGHILTGALIITYTKDQSRSSAAKLFVLSRALLPVAWIIWAFKLGQENVIILIVSNSLMFISVGMELMSIMILRNHYTQKVRKAYLMLLVSCITIFFVITTMGYPEHIRIAAASSMLAILVMYPVHQLWNDKHASTLQRTVALIYGSSIVILLVRAVAAFFTTVDMGWTSTSFFNTWLFLLIFVVMLAGSMGFLLLDKESHDVDLMKAASFDGLTDILNRKTFLLRANEVIVSSIQYKEPVSFLLIDIDDFKSVNDQHGHYTGDAVLQDFANILKRQLRNCDLFGRFGGEEFAVLLPGVNENIAKEVAERLRNTIEQSSFDLKQEIRYTISVGYHTVIVTQCTSLDEMYQLCDQALYMAKAKGKNCCMRAVVA